MNKFFIISLLLTVALAAQAKTNAQCNKDFPKCPQCNSVANQAKKSCTSKTTITCQAIRDCYSDVKKADAKKAKNAQKVMTTKYGQFCPTDKSKCVDMSANCQMWATGKQCTQNPDWMLPNCANSCCPLCTGQNTLLNTGTCPPKTRKDLCVKNVHSSCHTWFKNKECTKNPKWMRTNCMQSCCPFCRFDADKCPTVKQLCKNKYSSKPKGTGNKQCIQWAKNGECNSNRKWMMSNCAKQCCPICAPVAPAQAQLQPRQVVYQSYQQPRQVVYGGYSAGLPYQGR